MESCGKINASNSGSDRWTGIGVVAGFCTVVLIMQWPHRRNDEVTWRSELLQRLQEVRGNCKTRNQLMTRVRRAGLTAMALGGAVMIVFALSMALFARAIAELYLAATPQTAETLALTVLFLRGAAALP